MANHIRWYVNISKWKPTRDEWLKLTSSIARDELQRINKFVYQEDSKCSLIGHALIRVFLSLATKQSSDTFVLGRNQYGRPEVSKRMNDRTNVPTLLDFNVSHSGDYCVFAGIWCHEKMLSHIESVRIGVDATKIVRKSNKVELDRFLTLMSRREFTKNEWETVKRAASDRQKCVNFTRLWCLKESFIKAIGLGLSFKLYRLDFRFPDSVGYDLSVNVLKSSFQNSTTVRLDKQLAVDWQFYETALDDEHLVALAYNIDATESCSAEQAFELIAAREGGPFVEKSIHSIVEALAPINEPNEHDWTWFDSRKTKPIV